MFPPNIPRYDEFGRLISYTDAPPDYSPVTIAPSPPTANEQALANLQIPQAQDYRPNRLHTVLNAIAGGLAGLSGGPKVGLEVGRNLSEHPFNVAMQNYLQQQALLKDKSSVEEKQFTRGKEAAQLGIQRGGAMGLNTKREADVERDKEKLKQATTKQVSLDQYRKAKLDFEKFKLDNPQLPPEIRAAEFLMNMSEEDRPAAREAIKDLHPQLSPEAAAAKVKAETTARIDASTTPEAIAKQAKLAGATGGTRAGAAAQAQLNVATNPENAEKKIKYEADLAHAKSIAQLTASEKDTFSKSQKALQAFPDIYRQADAASDDLFANRWKSFTTKTLGKEDSAQYAALRENVELMQSLITQIHIGNRGVSSILKKFEDMFNVDKMTKTTFLHSIQEAEKWIKRYAQLPNATRTNTGPELLKQIDNEVEGKPAAKGKYVIGKPVEVK